MIDHILTVASISEQYRSYLHRSIHFFYQLIFIYQGDSGSPLVCCWGGSYILVGVTSWGSSTCKNYPSVYTDVSTISPWITSTVTALRNHHCTENTNSPDVPVKLYWWTEECDTWYGWIYACTLTESMTWPRRHQLSSRQYAASNPSMIYAFKNSSWGLSWVIWIFCWRRGLDS